MLFRSKPLRKPKFVADVHLGRLARYMRMTGLDVLYNNKYDDEEIVKISTGERRAILTKDRGILKRNHVTHGYWVRSTKVKEQLREVISRFDLNKELKEFSRCIECNTKLKKISKGKIIDELPPKVAAWHNEFFCCPSCNKIYWKGSHYQRMLSAIEEVKESQQH